MNRKRRLPLEKNATNLTEPFVEMVSADCKEEEMIIEIPLSIR